MGTLGPRRPTGQARRDAQATRNEGSPDLRASADNCGLSRVTAVLDVDGWCVTGTAPAVMVYLLTVTLIRQSPRHVALRFDKELYVYNRLRSEATWGRLNAEEQIHASKYIAKVRRETYGGK